MMAILKINTFGDQLPKLVITSVCSFWPSRHFDTGNVDQWRPSRWPSVYLWGVDGIFRISAVIREPSGRYRDQLEPLYRFNKLVGYVLDMPSSWIRIV